MNIIIIPAYKPNDRLPVLVDELLHLKLTQIVIVDDGGKEDFASLFNGLKQKGCHVIHHDHNLGKGAAIKTGVRYAYEHIKGCTGYVTCDADGQHLANDILLVAKALEEHPDSLVLGTRDLHSDNVPKKSRFGNAFSSTYFKLVTGIQCSDTQTGLRGIPLSLTETVLALTENRYDFEMTFLIQVIQEKQSFVSVPIATVYEDNNSSSHFRPIMDSLRIYKEPLKFTAASLTSAIVDLGIFTVLISFLDNPILILVGIATISARIISGIFNFLVNRIWSFKNRNAIKPQFLKYFILYIGILLSSITLVTVLSFLPIHLTLVKVIVDGLLFICSFVVQKKWVFSHKSFQ